MTGPARTTSAPSRHSRVRSTPASRESRPSRASRVSRVISSGGQHSTSSSGKSTAVTSLARSRSSLARRAVIREPSTPESLTWARCRAALEGRGNGLGHGLGLGEVQLAVQKGPLGVFAGLGGPRPEHQDLFEHRAHDAAPAVAMELQGVLPCVGAGAGHEHGQGLVQGVAPGVHQGAMVQDIGPEAGE